ncbi:MAG: alpha/beta hydrolase family protein [Bacilli bacterium]
MLTKLIHSIVFSSRCDKDPGLYYFPYSHFPHLNHELSYFKDRHDIDIASHLYYYDSKENKDIVIFVHGYGGGHDCYIKEIEYLASKGFVIYALDALATFASKGKKQYGLLELSFTLDYFINYVKKMNVNNKKINIIGHSLGGFSSALNLKTHSFNKVVLLSPLRNVKFALSNFVKKEKILNSLINIETKKFHKSIDEIDISYYLKDYQNEVLFIYSKDDKILNVEDNFLSLKNELKDKDNIHFIELDKKSHYPTYSVDSVTKLEKYFLIKNKTKGKKKLIKLKEEQNWDELYSLDIEIMNKISDFLLS